MPLLNLWWKGKGVNNTCHSGLSLTSMFVAPAVWRQNLSTLKSKHLKYFKVSSKHSPLIWSLQICQINYAQRIDWCLLSDGKITTLFLIKNVLIVNELMVVNMSFVWIQVSKYLLPSKHYIVALTLLCLHVDGLCSPLYILIKMPLQLTPQCAHQQHHFWISWPSQHYLREQGPW